MTDAELYDYVSSNIEIFQNKEEITWALSRMRNFIKSPKVILENGVRNGGNLCMMSNLVDEDGLLIGVDIDAKRLKDNEKFIKETCKCEVVLIGKEIKESFDDVKEILGDREIDILIHDSLHSEAQLKWEIFHFGTLTNSQKNILMVHDIVMGSQGNTELLSDGSKRLRDYWNELKTWYPYEEKRVNVFQDLYGIGLLFLGGKLWKE